MIKLILSDWKFYVMFVVAVAAAFSPTWLDKLQAPEKEIDVKVISKSALQIPTNDAATNLQLVLDGKVLVNSYLSILRISNEGRKPILSGDFEAPLEIRLGKQQNIVRAIVSEKFPKDIQAVLDFDGQAIRLKPTLLNRQEAITIEIISTGGLPTFDFSSRIVGVGAITVQDASKKSMNPVAVVLFLLISYIALIPALASSTKVYFHVNAAPVTLNNRTVLAFIAIAVICGEVQLIDLLDILEMHTTLNIFIGMVILFIAAIPFANLLERRTNTAFADSSEATTDRPVDPPVTAVSLRAGVVNNKILNGLSMRNVDLSSTDLSGPTDFCMG